MNYLRFNSLSINSIAGNRVSRSKHFKFKTCFIWKRILNAKLTTNVKVHMTQFPLNI